MGKTIDDDKLLEALLVHGTVRQTATAVGLSQNAIYRRLQNDDFRARYNSMQGVLLSVTASSMCDALGDAVNTLRAVVNDKDAADGVRVSASDALLRHACRYVEVANVLERLERLENAMQDEKM